MPIMRVRRWNLLNGDHELDSRRVVGWASSSTASQVGFFIFTFDSVLNSCFTLKIKTDLQLLVHEIELSTFNQNLPPSILSLVSSSDFTPPFAFWALFETWSACNSARRHRKAPRGTDSSSTRQDEANACLRSCARRLFRGPDLVIFEGGG